MVRVSTIASDVASDPVTAWRIRDALAAYPLLGGATAQIDVIAGHECIVLEGWTWDEELTGIAGKLAARVAGNRPVENRIRTNRCRHTQRPIRIENPA